MWHYTICWLLHYNHFQTVSWRLEGVFPKDYHVWPSAFSCWVSHACYYWRSPSPPIDHPWILCLWIDELSGYFSNEWADCTGMADGIVLVELQSCDAVNLSWNLQKHPNQWLLAYKSGFGRLPESEARAVLWALLAQQCSKKQQMFIQLDLNSHRCSSFLHRCCTDLADTLPVSKPSPLGNVHKSIGVL